MVCETGRSGELIPVAHLATCCFLFTPFETVAGLRREHVGSILIKGTNMLSQVKDMLTTLILFIADIVIVVVKMESFDFTLTE